MTPKHDFIDFLFQIADLGSRLDQQTLKSKARFLLNLIPADLVLENHLLEASRGRQIGNLEQLFFASSPSQVLYCLQLAHAMLLPAKWAGYTKEFQVNFFVCGGLRLCLAMLSQNNFLHQADVETRQRANLWLLYLLKFHLYVAGRLLVSRVISNRSGSIEKRVEQQLLGIFHKLRDTFSQVAVPDTDQLQAEASSMLTSHSAAQVLDSILTNVPGPYDFVFRQNSNVAIRNLISVSLPVGKVEVDYSHVEAVMKLAWIAGSGCTYLSQSSQYEEVHKAYDSELFVTPFMEDLCREALDVLALSIAVCPACVEKQMVRDNQNWKLFMVDILLSQSPIVRFSGSEIFYIIAKHSAVLSAGVVEHFIQSLFAVLGTLVDTKAKICLEYFRLLCKLLDFCRVNRFPVNDVELLLESQLKWLTSAKEYTTQNLECFPRDALLDGHLRVTKELLHFLEPEKKLHYGTAVDKNSNTSFVKDLLDDFLLPASRMFVEQQKSTAVNMQRSSTVSAGISSSAASTSVESSETVTVNVMPRSVTTIYSPSRCVPVCSSPRSMQAAFEVVVGLCNGCLGNMQQVVDILTEMFYSENAHPISEWEYAPQVALRGGITFVGLKNGGATCYMNSVFQQLFMIEPLRKGLLSADPASIEDEDSDGEDLITTVGQIGCSSSSDNSTSVQSKEEYNLSILRCVQLMFAHLLGSQLQFYVPKKFWKIFKFCNEPINLREQQDALEFFNSVVDSVDEALKGLGQDMICSKIFGGIFEDQIICKDCPHRYQSEASFTSLSVDVRNHSRLQDSLQEYVKGDLLEYDNAYKCEKCEKKVTAVKRMCMKKLPPILAIQLKRFDYDWEKNTPIKFNDYFEFPRVLDMEPYTVQGLVRREGDGTSESLLSPPMEASKTEFIIRGIIVHSGQANGGHYFSMIRCRGSSADSPDKWYKFDDGDVTECDMQNDEELKNQCFGGDFQRDTLDPYMKRIQTRRQKRWWNAYILLYEQAEDNEITLSQQLEEMTLSSRLRQMPSTLEAIVRRKNTRFVHDRNQFTGEFFAFMRRLCLANCFSVQQKIGNPETRGEAVKLALLSIQLFSKFLFTTGLHARKALRGPVQEWLEIFRVYFQWVPECRNWFAHHIFVARPVKFSEYLVDSPSVEVRGLFQHILVYLAQYSKGDDLSKIGIADSVGSVSDQIIKSVWNSVHQNLSYMGRNAMQLFGFFCSYAMLGDEEKEQLFRLNIPVLLTQLCLEEESYEIRNMNCDLQRCFMTILYLTRSSDISRYCSTPDGSAVRKNPFALKILRELPEDLGERIFGSEKFLKKLMDSSAVGTEEAKQFIQFVCWENFAFSKTVMKILMMQMGISFGDTRPYVDLALHVLVLGDSWHEQRINLSLRGDDKIKGLLQCVQEEHSRASRQSYLLIKILTHVFEHSRTATEMLDGSADLKKKWVNVIKWLHAELERKQYGGYQYGQWQSHVHVQSNESSMSGSVLERTSSAKNILVRAVDIVQKHCVCPEIQQEDVNSEEDDFHETCQRSTSGQQIPEDPPPPYTPTAATSTTTISPGGIKHSQSASSNLRSSSEEKGSSINCEVEGGRRVASESAEKNTEPGSGVSRMPQSQSTDLKADIEESTSVPFRGPIQAMQTEPDLRHIGEVETGKEGKAPVETDQQKPAFYDDLYD